MASLMKKHHHLVALFATFLNSHKATPTGLHRRTEVLVPPAPGATIHASIAGGAALNVSTAFTRMIPATNIRLSRGAAGVATVYTITGTRFGVAQTETIDSNGASDVEGVKVFDTVTNIASDVDPTTTTTVKTGVILGLAGVATHLDYLAVAATSGANAVAETGTLNAAKDGVTPTTAPDGTKVFHFRYLAEPLATGLYFHLDRYEAPITAANASDLATSLVLAEAVRVTYLAHLADDLAHKAADPPPALTAATSLATAITLANAIKADMNTHIASTTYHYVADGVNTIAATDASDQGTLNTLLNELKGDLNLHMASGPAAPSLRAVAI